MITAIICSLFIGFIVGMVFHECISYERNPFPCSHWDYEDKCGKLSSMETKIFLLEREKERMDYILRDMQRNRRDTIYPYFDSKKYYAVDKERQDLVDIITKGQKSAEQLAKELNLEI